MKMIFNYDANKTHFHNKGFALSLVLKVRFFRTRKWPIDTKVSILWVQTTSKQDNWTLLVCLNRLLRQIAITGGKMYRQLRMTTNRVNFIL